MSRPSTPQRASRGGFTLVELLVVIAIIAVLVGLVMAAVQRIRGKGQELAARNDLTQFEAVLGQFRAKFNRNAPCGGGGPPYSTATPASRNQLGTFRLCSSYVTSAGTNLTEADPTSSTGFREWPEIAILKSMFGRMSLVDNGLRFGGNPVTNANPVLLDPNQCMVFFLTGGSFNEYLGFATSPTQPFTPPAPGTQRLPGTPFFELHQGQLLAPNRWFSERVAEINSLPAPPAPALVMASNVYRWEGGTDTISTGSNALGSDISNAQPWFIDPWRTPYLYLAGSGVGTGGDYPPPVYIAPWGGKICGYNRAAGYTGSQGASAFQETATKFINHNGVQVVSGGPNGSKVKADKAWGFGPGGSASFGGSPYTVADPGGDDYGNFRVKMFSLAD